MLSSHSMSPENYRGLGSAQRDIAHADDRDYAPVFHVTTCSAVTVAQMGQSGRRLQDSASRTTPSSK